MLVSLSMSVSAQRAPTACTDDSDCTPQTCEYYADLDGFEGYYCGGGGGSFCGDPSGHDCFFSDGPFCSNKCEGDTCNGCCEAVCETDPFCCETEWDGQCAGEAVDLCELTPITCTDFIRDFTDQENCGFNGVSVQNGAPDCDVANNDEFCFDVNGACCDMIPPPGILELLIQAGIMHNAQQTGQSAELDAMISESYNLELKIIHDDFRESWKNGFCEKHDAMKMFTKEKDQMGKLDAIMMLVDELRVIVDPDPEAYGVKQNPNAIIFDENGDIAKAEGKYLLAVQNYCCYVIQLSEDKKLQRKGSLTCPPVPDKPGSSGGLGGGGVQVPKLCDICEEVTINGVKFDKCVEYASFIDLNCCSAEEPGPSCRAVQTKTTQIIPRTQTGAGGTPGGPNLGSGPATDVKTPTTPALTGPPQQRRTSPSRTSLAGRAAETRQTNIPSWGIIIALIAAGVGLVGLFMSLMKKPPKPTVAETPKPAPAFTFTQPEKPKSASKGRGKSTAKKRKS